MDKHHTTEHSTVEEVHTGELRTIGDGFSIQRAAEVVSRRFPPAKTQAASRNFM